MVAAHYAIQFVNLIKSCAIKFVNFIKKDIFIASVIRIKDNTHWSYFIPYHKTLYKELQVALRFFADTISLQ